MTCTVLQDFDIPRAHGFTMHGWDFTGEEIREALLHDRILNPAIELGTNVCPWNCAFCFTEDPANSEAGKRRLANEMTIDRRLQLIDELADYGCRSINFVGAGEPTIDPHFWPLLIRMRQRGITPIVYTEAALRLQNCDFAQRLFDSGATVVVKVNSLFDRDYQNAVVRGNAWKVALPSIDYFAARNRAIEVLLDVGFADSVPTRLAFDTIITTRNYGEIERLHRFARSNNIFILLVNYLPSGRSSELQEDAISYEKQRELFGRLAAIDAAEFGLQHATQYPYAGGVPCTIRGLGLYVKISGDVFDCPGESQRLGSLRDQPFGALWAAAKDIRTHFDGMCLPRQLFWERVATANERIPNSIGEKV
ncbi:MAG: radical SAM protein [Acidobacteriota bacterium]|nr:radical SAM protein [Acidobacteriota bacterium]